MASNTSSHGNRVDHGYAWIITLTGFLWNIIISVVFKCLGVLHIEIKELFGESSFRTSLVAFVMSICWVIFSPIGGYLTYKWSYRITICIGTLLATGEFKFILTAVFKTKSPVYIHV